MPSMLVSRVSLKPLTLVTRNFVGMFRISRGQLYILTPVILEVFEGVRDCHRSVETIPESP